jgi:hypothetical protein
MNYEEGGRELTFIALKINLHRPGSLISKKQANGRDSNSLVFDIGFHKTPFEFRNFRLEVTLQPVYIGDCGIDVDP